MAKKRRAAPKRPPARKQKPAPARRTKPAAARIASAARVAIAKEAPKVDPPPPPAPPAPRKPAFYEALAIYETGVRGMQRHDFASAAGNFREVIGKYPDERELCERARLFLQVCERETARRPPPPQTASEAVYAATVALNAGNPAAALDHLSKALEQAPNSDHAHYIMAVALTERGDPDRAMVHLRQAITLNPDNRSTAIQDPDLMALRDLDAFRDVLGTSHPLTRRSSRIRVRR
jgi:tetratricopeptide (TPR) repeat protein